MTTYSEMIDGLDDLVTTYEGNPEMQGDYAKRLYMVMRGKHYDEAQAREVLKNVAKNLREDADKLDALATPELSAKAAAIRLKWGFKP